MSRVFVLVYTSKSLHPIEAQLLTDILDVSRKHNARDGITGFLVARDGYFLQLLEGDETKVLACYERIVNDTRHTQVLLQGHAEVKERLMADWNMALVSQDFAGTSSADMVELFALGRRNEKYRDVKSLMSILTIFSRNAKLL